MTLDIPDETLSAIGAAQTLAGAGDTPGAVEAFEALLDSLTDDSYQVAAVAHMYALIVEDPSAKMAVNERALAAAERVADRFPAPLFASLYANLGYSERQLEHPDRALEWYLKAQEAATALPDDDYGRAVRNGIEEHLAAIRSGLRLPDRS